MSEVAQAIAIANKGDYAGLDSGRHRFYRWGRQAGTLLVALFVYAVLFGAMASPTSLERVVGYAHADDGTGKSQDINSQTNCRNCILPSPIMAFSGFVIAILSGVLFIYGMWRASVLCMLPSMLGFIFGSATFLVWLLIGQ